MLQVNNIVYSYAERPVLNDISFHLGKGKHLAVMGESGSGKSTLLKAIYGLLHLNHGNLFWKEKQLLGPNFNLIPGEKSMKYVAQDFDLMPFTTVKENISDYLSAFDQDTHEDRVLELLQIIEMEAYAQVKVKNLSGGQQQRVALARALAQQPEVLLLDEPFSSIDQFKKNDLRHKLFPFLKEQGVTVINATHDPNDVLPFADEVLVLRNGETIALEPTINLYNHPKELYIAALFDMVNSIPASLVLDDAPKDKMVLLYPNELELSETSGIEAYIANNHFKGGHYLIEAVTKEGFSVYFRNANALEVHSKVLVNAPMALLSQRLE